MPDIMQHYGFVLELVFTRALDRGGWHACRALQPTSARPPWLPCMPEPLWPSLAALRRAASSYRQAPSTMSFPSNCRLLPTRPHRSAKLVGHVNEKFQQ